MANAFRAGFHRMAHLVRPVPVGSRERVTRYRHFSAACSVGKCPLALTARRYRALRDSGVILSFRVSRGCDLRRPVVDSVADGMLAA
jgi:hypothetical protein